MNFLRSYRLLTLGSLLLAGLLTACGDDDPAAPETPDLSGTYELVSITFQGQPALAPPTAQGTFTLTETTYQVDITIDLPPPLGQDIQDQGTYSIDGNAWTQESSDTGLQSVGTFTFDGTRLEVSATTMGQTVTSVWNKLP